MSKYETTFVIDSLQKSEGTQNILTKVQNFIKNNGGEIGEVEDWGKKRLAYEINRKQYGNYCQIHFEGPSNLPGLLEREYRLEEGILRFLTVLSDPKAALKREEPVEPAKETKEAEGIPEDAKTEDKPGENNSSKEEAVVEHVKEEVKEIEEVKETEETKE